jgi:hypothetical protein
MDSITAIAKSYSSYHILHQVLRDERKGVKTILKQVKMETTLLAHAQQLIYILLCLMPSQYQRDSWQALLGLFLEAQGHPLPQHSKVKSASALSRFLNIYPWSTRKLIRTIRQTVLKQILSQCPKGRRPFLQVIIDLTPLEKRGKFKPFEYLIRVYNGKRGYARLAFNLTFRTLNCHIDYKDIETLAKQGFQYFRDKSLYRSAIINS